MWRDVDVDGYRVDVGSDGEVFGGGIVGEEVVCVGGSVWNRVMYESEAVTAGAVTADNSVVWKVTELGV